MKKAAQVFLAHWIKKIVYYGCVCIVHWRFFNMNFFSQRVLCMIVVLLWYVLIFNGNIWSHKLLARLFYIIMVFLGFKKVHFLDKHLMKDPIIDMIENIVTFVKIPLVWLFGIRRCKHMVYRFCQIWLKEFCRCCGCAWRNVTSKFGVVIDFNF